ncbi:hypothetical protein C2S51_035268 [Perilla frutescens var. frutescens]|nr:hypothetical protein C2S51_035268 [Perilla frutescens var. frutescens]
MTSLTEFSSGSGAVIRHPRKNNMVTSLPSSNLCYIRRQKYSSCSTSSSIKSYPGASLRYLCSPKPTSPEPGSYIINPSPAASDPDHHSNTVKFLLKRVYGDTDVTNSLHFSADKISNEEEFFSLESAFDLPYFEKTNSIGCRVGRWFHLQTYRGEALLWDPSTDDVVYPPVQKVPPGTYRSDLISSCFGFDSTSHDFKLIKFMTNRIQTEETSDHVGQTVLYSVNRDSWKDITEVAANASSNVYYTPAYINGVAYWAGAHSITSFDFAHECFSEISYPKKLDTYICKVVEFEGSLGVIVYPQSGNEKRFELWVQEKSVDGGSWVRKWSSVNVCGADMPLGLSRNGESLFVQGVDHELIEYDIAAKEVKNLGVHSLMWKMAVMPYVETASMGPYVDGKAYKFKAKMLVTKADDIFFASADKWKLTYAASGVSLSTYVN